MIAKINAISDEEVARPLAAEQCPFELKHLVPLDMFLCKPVVSCSSPAFHTRSVAFVSRAWEGRRRVFPGQTARGRGKNTQNRVLAAFARPAHS
jgi:hypothetical protein